MNTDPVDRLVDAIVERVLTRLAERLEATESVVFHELHG